MSERRLQVQVGALILVAVAIGVGFVAVLGSFSLGPRRTLYIELTDSGSVLSGAPVKIAGVRAGRVDQVEFLVARDARRSPAKRPDEPPINVRLTLSLDAHLADAVRADSTFIVTTQGVLGEKYVEIVPGTGSAPVLTEGATLRGQDPPRIDLLFARADAILEQIEAAMTGGGDFELGELIATLARLTKRLDALLARNEAQLDQALTDAAATISDVRALAGAARNAVGDGEHIAAILQDARRITAVGARELPTLTQAARQALTRADAALTDGHEWFNEQRPQLNATLARLPRITARVDDALADAHFLITRLREGAGTVGQLLTDREMYDDLKELLRELKRHPWKVLWRE